MIRKKFINREQELHTLEKLWSKDNFSLVVIYGRRRVGKTRLLMEFARGKKCVYYIAVEAPYEALYREFSTMVKRFLDIPISGDFLEVIESASEIIKDRILFILDEFQYIVEADPSIPSRLQRLIDSKLSRRNIMLILCGSAVSFFEKKLLGYKSPLFGRREASLKIRPFRFSQIREFFPNYNLLDLIRIYSVVGGIPAYLEKLDPNKSVEENVLSIITPGNYLYDEAPNFLRQEVREPRTYFSILAAMAEGRNSPSEVASAARIDARSVSKYIDLLEELDIITRIKPLGFKKPVKLIFKDNYFRFWFRYIYKLRSLLEAGYIEEALNYILDTFDQYISEVFENIIAEIIPTLHKTGNIKTRPIQIGKWWHKDLEIDTIVREPGRSSTFIETKWRSIDAKEAERIITKLEEKSSKTGLTSPSNYYILIAKKINGAETPLILDDHRMIMDLKSLESIILS